MAQIQTLKDDGTLGIELYNTVMAELNPDLLTTNPESIDEKRPGESDEEFAIRMERYGNDLEECGRRLQLMQGGRAVKARIIKEEKHKELSHKETKTHSQEIEKAEQDLTSFDDQ